MAFPSVSAAAIKARLERNALDKQSPMPAATLKASTQAAYDETRRKKNDAKVLRAIDALRKARESGKQTARIGLLSITDDAFNQLEELGYDLRTCGEMADRIGFAE